MKQQRVFLWSIVIALGGFLFGFDTAVISGAEQFIQKYWQLSEVEHGFTISIALIGTVIGSLMGALPSDALGRKKTLYIIAALYLISSLGSAFSTNWYAFLFFRFAGGLGVGASSVTAPIYISEIAPAERRGRLVALFQFNIVLGILMSYLSNYLVGDIGKEPWRIMLGVQAVPSLLFLVLLRTVPESPRWLIQHKQDTNAALDILRVINPDTAAATAQQIQQDLATAQTQAQAAKEPLFSMKNKTPIMLAVLFAFFNQLSGINAILYYAPRIFSEAGFGEKASLLSSVGVGSVNFIFTLLAMNFIDRFGRRSLMLVGSFGLIVTLGLVAYSFFHKSASNDPRIPVAVMSCLFAYIAFFAFSQGAVIWVFLSEIFPNTLRGKGQALGSTTHWVLAAVIAFSFPVMNSTIGLGNLFLIFMGMMVLQLLFVWRMMPETKGKSLEQLGSTLVMH
ncbi:MFS transporter [Chitinophaga parva]|uniref:MFS transporter n=1 Tax=Chitinophaga parva TaxID=2169414 RepID=A0A2T7BCD8_9BACT|nr:sugar porter family MFS transporter [Chitinophaga parva]PUZ22735.1 MFS transporter [Chitinophaga parva]